jgi:hypothetical protein
VASAFSFLDPRVVVNSMRFLFDGTDGILLVTCIFGGGPRFAFPSWFPDQWISTRGKVARRWLSNAELEKNSTRGINGFALASWCVERIQEAQQHKGTNNNVG